MFLLKEFSDKCLHFKSIQICSHTIAAAEVNGDLIIILQWFSNRGRQAPNFSKLSTHVMPAGASKKGGHPARKKKPILTDKNRVTLNTTTLFNPSTSDSRNCFL